MTGSSAGAPARPTTLPQWTLLAAGALGALLAGVLDERAAGAATSQNWPPFVLVAGLLLVGLVAHEEGLFAALGQQLARLAPGAASLFVGGCVAIAVVTALLNLDTAVAFLTPVLVHAARRRGVAADPLLYGSLLLANAGSLLLPGSNLTNLIVLGHLHLSGAQFLGRMWPSWLAAITITAVVVGVAERSRLRGAGAREQGSGRPALGVGALAVAAAVVLVITLAAPALPVFAVGAVATGIGMVRRRGGPRAIARALELPVLLGLFGVAVTLGTVGRAWSAPSAISGHVGIWGTAVVAAGAVGGREQPARGVAARGPRAGAPPGPPGRPQPRAKPVRHRLARLGAVAPIGVLGRRAPLDRAASRLGLLAVPPALGGAVALLVVRGH